MPYRVRSTSRFTRALDKFRRAHPEMGDRIGRVLRDLRDDPHQPRLQLHALHGELQGYHAVRLTYAYRITLQISDQTVTLIDIGSHDDVYG